MKPSRAVIWTIAATFIALPARSSRLDALTQAAQAQVPRILIQDAARDNLTTPAGYPTSKPGTLGAVARKGNGSRHMILIPGAGFGGEVFGALAEAFADTYTTWAVTLAGFGGTPAPPTPPAGTSFGAQTWTMGAVDAIGALMVERDIRDAVLVGHWLTGTQVALQVAAKHPDRVRAVILIAGAARMVQSGRPVPPLPQRVTYIDTTMAPKWFKTVTRETWDDNNFFPHDYAVNPVLGLRYWREAARPDLHVWVRYLCEFYAQDSVEPLTSLPMPRLLLLPGLEGLWHDPANPYLQGFTAGSWGDLSGSGVTLKTVPESRVVMWADRRDEVLKEMRGFLK